MTSNVDQFNKEVGAFAATLVPQEAVRFQKKLVFEALSRLVQKTPVDTGRARGNWQVTINELPNSEVTVWTRQDPQSPATPAEMIPAALGGLPPFQIVYITNNVEYIVYLEGGSSSQASEGMVEVTIAELIAQFHEET